MKRIEIVKEYFFESFKPVDDLDPTNSIDKIIMYLGISYDELHRMKRSDVNYVINKYPLKK